MIAEGIKTKAGGPLGQYIHANHHSLHVRVGLSLNLVYIVSLCPPKMHILFSCMHACMHIEWLRECIYMIVYVTELLQSNHFGMHGHAWTKDFLRVYNAPKECQINGNLSGQILAKGLATFACREICLSVALNFQQGL